MANDSFTLKVLGCRGSMAISGDAFREFGCATSSYLIEAAGEAIILDAGSGILSAPSEFERTPHILISHLHIDHIMGLGMYPRLSKKGVKTNIYVPAQTPDEASQALELLYSRPLWPVTLSDYAGDVRILTVPDRMRVGEVEVESMGGSHPGGCRVFRISACGKTMVYATDFEHNDEDSRRLAEFASSADLILYDGQYSVDAYESHRGFGHSTAEEGVRLMERSGAKRLLVAHHDPLATDDQLRMREAEMGSDGVVFAREGEVIEL